jgi:hypothetical protein
VQDDTAERIGQEATHEIACRSRRFEIGSDLSVVVRSAQGKERLRSGSVKQWWLTHLSQFSIEAV